MAREAQERFSDRVADYVRYRPDYPPQVMEFLQRAAGLSAGSVVADIGSGTGIFTQHLLKAGCRVYAVEPNAAMREAAEAALVTFPGFISVAGSAGHTRVGDDTVDLVLCAQSFHWFNTPETKAEFQRILKPAGLAALIWNNRLTDADAFSVAYEELLQQRGTDYGAVNHQNLSPADFEAFFREGRYEKVSFPNAQILDAAGLAGRAFSASYVPAADTPAGARFAELLSAVFERFAEDGHVRVRYMTDVYLGGL